MEVRTREQWSALQASFKERHPKVKGGDLRRALGSELNEKELARARQALQTGGDAVWDPPPPPKAK